MTDDIRRAIERQKQLEDASTPGPWESIDGYRVIAPAVDSRIGTADEGEVFNPQSDRSDADGILIAHARNQLRLARDCIEAAADLREQVSGHCYFPDEDLALKIALGRWVDHINGEKK